MGKPLRIYRRKLFSLNRTSFLVTRNEKQIRNPAFYLLEKTPFNSAFPKNDKCVNRNLRRRMAKRHNNHQSRNVMGLPIPSVDHALRCCGCLAPGLAGRAQVARRGPGVVCFTLQALYRFLRPLLCLATHKNIVAIILIPYFSAMRT